jgi:hypothetical protein
LFEFNVVVSLPLKILIFDLFYKCSDSATVASQSKKKFRVKLQVRIEDDPESNFEEMYITKPTMKELKRRICEKFAPR